MKKEFTELETNRWHNFIFFSVLWLLTYIIHYFATDSSQYSESFEGQLGSTIVVVVMAFIPYWIVKLLIALTLIESKGRFIWPKNIMLYFIPFVIWFFLIYLFYFQYL
tara:strand:- start:2131 stop:2454 length:324 start_codon:yes stop_codon:yes gene_type:complete